MRKRRDLNHKEIATNCRRLGMSVVDLADVGNDCPDLLIGWRGKNYLVEVKSGKNALRDGQRQFADNWRGLKPVQVNNFNDIVKFILE